MADFALIKDGVVYNVIVADSIEIASEFPEYECIESVDDNIAMTGGTYNYSTKKFIPLENVNTEVI